MVRLIPIQLLCGALIMVMSVVSRAEDTAYDIVGSAYDADSGETLLYEERYTPVGEDGSAEVHYFNPEGDRIAHKMLDYSPGETRPDYRLVDERHGLVWGARALKDGRIELTRGPEDDADTKVVLAEDPQVVDAGFDPFIQSAWEQLVAGERVTFHFAFPNRLTNVALRVEQIRQKDSPIVRQQDNWVYFRLRVNSALLSLFADNLYLGYEPEQKRLAVFRGTSNIPDETGEGREVEVHYRYTE